MRGAIIPLSNELGWWEHFPSSLIAFSYPLSTGHVGGDWVAHKREAMRRKSLRFSLTCRRTMDCLLRDRRVSLDSALEGMLLL